MDHSFTESDSDDSYLRYLDAGDQEEIEQFANMIKSDHKSVQFEGLEGIRMIMDMWEPHIVQAVIKSGVLPRILEMMTWENESEFKDEGLSCLLNISKTEAKFCDSILDLGGLDIIINLLESPLGDYAYHAVWTIATLAKSSFKNRDICLQKDCLNKLLRALEKYPNSDGIIRNVLQGIKSICRGKPHPPGDQILPALPVLHKHISDVHSQAALEDALWSISYISGILFVLDIFLNELDENIQEVIDQGCVPFLFKYFFKESPDVSVVALRALANIAAGDDKQANEVLYDSDFLSKVFQLANRTKIDIFLQEAAFYTIRKIAGGNSKRVGMILENKDYMTILKAALFNEKVSTRGKREPALAIINMFSAASSEQTYKLIHQHGVFKILACILDRADEFEDDLKLGVLNATIKLLNPKEEEDNLEVKSYFKIFTDDLFEEIWVWACINHHFSHTNADLLKSILRSYYRLRDEIKMNQNKIVRDD